MTDQNPATEPAPAEPQPARAQPAAYEPPAEPLTKKPAEVVFEKTPDDEVKPGDPAAKRAADAAADIAATWLGLYRQPPSIAEAWRMSSRLDRKRVPDESGLLAAFWLGLNLTERVLLFGIIGILLAVVSTLLYCARRPTGRVGLWIVIIVVFIVVPAMAGS